MAAAAHPWSALRSFPYYENYARLTRLELLARYGARGCAPHSALCIGSGPLPLTALWLAAEHDIAVTAVDRDGDACGLADKLAFALGVRALRVCHSNALEPRERSSTR